MAADRTYSHGPIEQEKWPDRLGAHVVTAEAAPRIHGYSVADDLARHYGFVETALLALTGEIPTEAQARAANIALVMLAPAPVATAPVHAAVLARLCGATSSALLGVGCLGLAEQAQTLLEPGQELVRWLHQPQGAPPEKYRAVDADDAARAQRFVELVRGTGLQLAPLDASSGLDAALILVLYRCGLKRTEQIAALIIMARLPCLVAEALACKARNFAAYPMRLPDFEYAEQP